MKPYSDRDNTADITVRIFAITDSELVANCVYAVATLIHRIVGLRAEAKADYSASYSSPEIAAVDLANHILSEFEISNTLYFSVRKLHMEAGFITAQLRGHHFSGSIKQRNVLKAVTYHNVHFNPIEGYMDLTIDI